MQNFHVLCASGVAEQTLSTMPSKCGHQEKISPQEVSVKVQPLVEEHRVRLPPLQIKLGLMKFFFTGSEFCPKNFHKDVKQS